MPDTESETLGWVRATWVLTRPSGDFDMFYNLRTTNLESQPNCSLRREVVDF